MEGAALAWFFSRELWLEDSDKLGPPAKERLQAIDGFRPIHEVRVFGQARLRVETADQIKAKGVEGANPHGSGSILVLGGDALGHFARRLVGKGEDEDSARIDSVGEKPLDAGNQGFRFPGPPRFVRD